MKNHQPHPSFYLVALASHMAQFNYNKNNYS